MAASTGTTKLVALVGTLSVVVRRTSPGLWVVRVLDTEGTSVNAMLTPRSLQAARRDAERLALQLVASASSVRTEMA